MYQPAPGQNSDRLPDSRRALPAPAPTRLRHARREHFNAAFRQVAQTRRRQNIVGYQVLHPGTRVNNPHRTWSLLLRDPGLRPMPPMPSCHSPCFQLEHGAATAVRKASEAVRPRVGGAGGPGRGTAGSQRPGAVTVPAASCATAELARVDRLARRSGRLPNRRWERGRHCQRGHEQARRRGGSASIPTATRFVKGRTAHDVHLRLWLVVEGCATSRLLCFTAAVE